MPPYFDVRTLTPTTPDCIATRSINLMCAILKGIDYRTLYMLPFHQRVAGRHSTLDNIINNINGLHGDLQVGATQNTPIVIPLLGGQVGAFVRIRAALELAGTPAIHLGELYHQPRQFPTIDPVQILKNFIVNELESVHKATGDQMYHFCVPFRAIQLGRRTTHPTSTEFGRIFGILGHRTMQQFFDTEYTPEEKAAAIAARQCGILKEVRPTGSKPSSQHAEHHDGNSRRCDPATTRCTASPIQDDWCNDVTFPDGSIHCALGSD